jgi:hypothetical protein
MLGKLREAGLAMSSREGRADRWHLDTDDAVLRSWLEKTRSEPSSAKALVLRSSKAVNEQATVVAR